MYDDVAANRFVLLNSSRLREGQETAEGVMVEVRGRADAGRIVASRVKVWGRDDDDVRRGRPTVHIAYDEMTAVLAGEPSTSSAIVSFDNAREASTSHAFSWVEV